MVFSTQVGGLPTLLRKYDSKIVLGAPLQTLLTRASLLGERHARENAPRDKGDLARDITSEVREIDARVFLRRDVLYYRVMEEGRRVGAPMPPIAPIAAWAARKGIDIPAFVLARAISRRGIKGRFFMRAARARVEKELPRLSREMGRDVEKEFRRTR